MFVDPIFKRNGIFMQTESKRYAKFRNGAESISSKPIMTLLLSGILMVSCSFSDLYISTATPTETHVASMTSMVPSATSTSLVPSVTPLPTLGIGSVFSRPADDSEMLYVPEGEFTMGSNNAGDDEGPEHIVWLDGFWMDRTEVTNGMYGKCVIAKACKNPGTSQRSSKYDNFPVAEIRWSDAKGYCSWVNAKLPTEAQWEKAARGIDGRNYPWGNELDPERYYIDPKPSGIFVTGHKPVGSYPNGASPYGILDMTGSVFEWVNDMYLSNYYVDSPYSNPMGAVHEENKHFYRGGNYSDYDFRVFSRSLPVTSGEPDWVLYFNVGFRCAMAAAQ